MDRIDFKSLCIGFFAGLCLIFLMGAVGGKLYLGPYQIECGTHTLTYVQGASLHYKEVPVCLRIDTRSGRTWRYATYLYQSKGYKIEGFEQIPGALKKLDLLPRQPAEKQPCAPD